MMPPCGVALYVYVGELSGTFTATASIHSDAFVNILRHSTSSHVFGWPGGRLYGLLVLTMPTCTCAQRSADQTSSDTTVRRSTSLWLLTACEGSVEIHNRKICRPQGAMAIAGSHLVHTTLETDRSGPRAPVFVSMLRAKPKSSDWPQSGIID
jgi:hypothetical protein